MKIYTRTGDEGETGLFGGGRVSKAHPRIESYGTVDELNAVLGAALAEFDRVAVNLPEGAAALIEAQNRLFDLGAELATPDAVERGLAVIGSDDVERLERWIDHHEATLPALRAFVLPGGTALSAHLHIARTVCRRAERACVSLGETTAVRAEVLIYLNRLSDLLFVLARAANQALQSPDVPWSKKGSS